MVTLLAVGFVAGLVTAISPCILPVLPVIFAGASTGSRRRSVAIVVGLVTSFAAATLFGVVVLSALHLPQDLLNDIGYGLLILLAVALIVDPIGEWLERPFARLSSSPRVGAGTSSGLVLGAGLGLVFVPCAGLILSAITAVAATHRIGATAVALTASYSLGVAIPLLIFALLSQRLASSWAALRAHAHAVRRASGVVIGAMAVVILTGAAAGLQTDLPGFTQSVENSVPAGVETQLQHLTGEGTNTFAAKQSSDPAASIPDLGPAPKFTGITAWLNTQNGAPLTLAELRGKVVLVDFWTYSCINCRRSLPHVEAWYRAYRKDGLVVVGVHTPEFAFEHVVGNVASAASQLGVTYPIAVDDGYATWDAYNNQYWPAEYLIDQHGNVRHTAFGEGDYGLMERDIRDLLSAGGATSLPDPTEVANRTPTESFVTPESYLGYQYYAEGYNQAIADQVVQDQMTKYVLPAQPPSNAVVLGGHWAIHAEETTAGDGASFELQFTAEHVYLVLGGTGTVTASYDGARPTTVHVHGIPNLYTLFNSASVHSGILRVTATPGVRAFDLTFG
jgi:cytochrome c biogenesis protein CcdA/thiol-disulfide isomerase/thioredoxin